MRGRFGDRLSAPLPGFRDFVRIFREGGFKGKGDRAAEAREVPVRRGPLPPVAGGEASLTWIGHATCLVRYAGQSILTDPVLSPRVPGRIRRRVPLGLGWDELPPIDAAVLSHNHYDHLDAATARRMGPDVQWFVPLGMAHWFRRRGLRAEELDWWQAVGHGGTAFRFVPAHHWSRRGLWDSNDTLWGGWVLERPGHPTLHFGGDTGYGRWFKEIGQRLPGIDTAILPIGAYAPRWFMQDVHMDPAEAVQAMLDLGARRLAPMHWGTFVLTREPLAEPLRLVREAWAQTGRPREDLLDLAIGESCVLARDGAPRGRAQALRAEGRA